jgi:hypothetical protein
MNVYIWSLNHCQLIIHADSEEDARLVISEDGHLLDITKKESQVNKPKELKGRMIGILPRYNYIVEVKR